MVHVVNKGIKQNLKFGFQYLEGIFWIILTIQCYCSAGAAYYTLIRSLVILEAGKSQTEITELLLTTLTSGPNFCMIVAENAAPANNRR